MPARAACGTAATLALLLSVVSAQLLRYRWCHANAFAGRGHADWQTLFLGDSITFMFPFPATNYGYSGATTGDLRGILRDHIRCRCYRKVVILAGTNDVLKGLSDTQAADNLDAMVQDGQAEGLKVYLATVPPLFGKEAAKNAQVDALNQRIQLIASQRGIVLLDYNRAIKSHPEDSWDGVHLTNQGYAAVMRTLGAAHLD